MTIRELPCLLFSSVLAPLCCSVALAQAPGPAVLLEEDFNTCALPAGWNVRMQGDSAAATWYVGLAQIPDALNQSIDGSCFLFIDGSAGGQAAPAYVLEFVSPPFNRGDFTTLDCQMDVHFKFGDQDVLEVLATDGQHERVLARYDNFRTNYDPLGSSDFFRFRADLAFLPWVGPLRLVLRYTSPAGSKGRYAGVDNIRVVGSGSGTFVLKEDFDGCQLPPGWSGEVLSGLAGWSFGFVPLGSSAFYEGSSMNGTCFAFFDDNAQGNAAPPTHIRLYSPWFTGVAFMEYELTFEAIMRYSGAEALAVYLENDQGQQVTLFAPEGKVAGPFFPNYERFAFSLSEYRAAQWRLIFEYKDGGTHGYWAGLDNVKVVGRGAAVDFCEQALTLTTGAPCTAVDNTHALFNGPSGGCSVPSEGSVWLRWLADFDGPAELSVQGDFNDAVSIFTGDCTSLSWVLCANRDEHGFTGETVYFQAQKGKEHYIRISGVSGGFGRSRGQACVRIMLASQMPAPPPNDVCAKAHVLAPDAPCPEGTNRYASTSSWQPSHNRLARADVWYAFHAPALAPGEVLVLDAQANFAHILTVYSGTCQALTEVATHHQGSPLHLPPLVPGQLYYAQVAGVFATVEGDLCPTMRIEQRAPSPNHDCATALPVVLGATCDASANNLGATFSGLRPPCALKVVNDMWFQFKAPAFGAVRVNTGAAFDHVVAVWEGTCDELKPIFCSDRTRYCDGSLLVPALNAGQTYYLQIAARAGVPGTHVGNVCLTLRNAALPDEPLPLTLEVNQLCVGKDSVRLLVKPDGGRPPYTFWADTAGQVLSSGQPFGVVVRDAAGCETFFTGTAKPCEANICTGQLDFELLEPSCFGLSDGIIAAGVTAGTGPFFFEWSNGVFTATNALIPAGTYTLVVSETTGCTYTAEVTLEQPEALVIVVDSLINPLQGQSNGAIYVSVSGGTPPWSLQWTDSAGVVLAYGPILEGLAAGTYTLAVTDERGCKQTQTLTLTESVRVAERPSGSKVYLYPNPAHEQAWLGLELDAPSAVEVVLSDALGRQWLHRQLPAQEREVWMKLDLQPLPSGVYVVSLRAPHWASSRRLVVER